jgi:ferredoxin
MARYRFHVFSGTGNTMHLARSLAARLEASSAGKAASPGGEPAGGASLRSEFVEVGEAEIGRLRRGEGSSFSLADGSGPGSDLDFFLFPVFAMSVPRIMIRYIRALGRARPKGASGAKPRAAVLSTNGRISERYRDGHEGQSLAQAERMLRRRGWEVVYRDSFDYPQSIASIIKIQDEDRKAAIMALAEPRIEELAGKLASGEALRRPCRAWAQLVGWSFGWLYSIFGRRFLAMLYAADSSCDGCGLCARRCPAGAIRLRGRVPDWSYACEGCERCINACPKEAIQTSILRLAAFSAVFLAIELCPLKSDLNSFLGFLPALCFEPFWFVASAVLGFAIMRLVDLLLVALGRFKALRNVLAFGWTKWTGRYRAPVGAKE